MDLETVDKLLKKVMGQAAALGIPISSRIAPAVRINRRAKTRFGCCRQEDGGYVIELADSLLQGEERAVCQVLAHEILHSCRGCANHGARWKGYAARMNGAFGYAIVRADSFEGLGLADQRPARYLVECQRCAWQTKRMRRSPLVDHPERYRCRCGGALRVRTLPD